jgi:hypothetical protein
MVYDFADSTGPAGDVFCDEYVEACYKFGWHDVPDNCHIRFSGIVANENTYTMDIPFLGEWTIANPDGSGAFVFPDGLFRVLIDDFPMDVVYSASIASKTVGEIVGAIYEDRPKCAAFSLMPLAMVGEENWSYLFSSGGRFDCWGSDGDDEGFVKIIWGADAK